MNIYRNRSTQTITLIIFQLLCCKSYAACTEEDIPLGSGIVSSGNQITRTVEDQKANSGSSGDGIFNYSFNSNGGVARCGRHADGTWWVAPANSGTKVTLTEIGSNLSKIKAQHNPDPAARGFLDNTEDYGFYDGSKNIIANLPINYPLNNDATTSIFSAIQRTNNDCGTPAINKECVDYADFLTIYNSPPPNGGKNTIRPTLFGNNKQIYTWADFDRSRIPSLAGADWDYNNGEVLELISKWTATTEGFSIPVCDNNRLNCMFASEGGRAFRSHAVIDDYAAGGLQNRVLSYLLSNTSNVLNDVEDSALLAAVIAYGIDIITLIGNPPSVEEYSFSSGAGQFMNAANFSYFTASLSQRDGFLWNTMAVEVRSWLDTGLYAAPQEIQQIYDSGHGALWGDNKPDSDDFDRRRYWTELMNGMAHDNAENWYVFTTNTSGTTFQIKDDASGAVIPPLCNFGSDKNSYCRNNVVLVDDVMLGFFDHTPNGSTIVLKDTVPAGTVIQVSAITESWQGSSGGNRASADPHGFIDGPPAVPGFGYFSVSTGPRIEFAAFAQAIPELCEVVNTPNLNKFVERYFESGLQTGNDPCAPPSTADVNNGSCDVWRTSGCLDYGLSNDGTVRWGPDPRDNTQCVNNNRLLTQQTNGSWTETVENRGDNGRHSRFNNIKSNNLPLTYTGQYLAFKGNRDCVGLLNGGGNPSEPQEDDTEFCLPIKTDQGNVVVTCL